MLEFKFPDVGEGITEGELVKWLVKEGAPIKQDQAIAQIETDKAIVDIPSPIGGRILKLHYKEGDSVKVGSVLVTIGEEGESVTERKSVGVMGELEEAKEEISVREPRKKGIDHPKTEVKATPAVRRLAKEHNVDLSNIRGSGKDNRILAEDIEEIAGEEPPEKVALKAVKKYDIYGYVERIPLKGVRKTIARNMMNAFNSVAPVTAMDEIDITKLAEIREKEKKIAGEKNIKLTYLPFIIKAIIAGLKAHPYLNSTLENDEIILKKYYNLGIAVDTENGLIVPVVKGADKKSILEIAKEIPELAGKARNRTVDIADLKGGTFTITNYGSIGTIFGTPIINYPEAAILGIGQIQDKPLAINNKVEIRKVLPLSLTFDHRILDGAEAARFMNTLKRHLEDPDLLLIEMD